MITMSRGSDSRWYEPPPPRSWKTNPASLQRIESAENLRKALLDSAAKATGALPYRKSYRPQTRTMNRSFDYDRTKSMSSLPSTPLALQGSLLGSANSKIDASRIVQQSLTKQLSGSARDLSSSSTGFLSKLKTQENAEKILTNTPPSRPRTTTLTRFRPLPAIKHSAGSTRSDPTNINNNTGESKHPPPLLRSKTFDVLETHLDNLPVVDDDGDDDERSYTGSSDDDDDESDSGSDSDSGKDSDSNASDSGVVSAESNRNKEAQARKEQREAIFERSVLNGPIPVQTVTVTIEGKLISEYASQTKMGAIRSRPYTQQGRDAAVNNSASSPSDNSDDSDEESSGSDNSDSENEEEEEEEGEEEDGGEEEEDEGGGDEEEGEEEEGEDETSRVGATLPDIFEDEELFTAVDGGIEEDIIVYVKMPDDTLMLASSPKGRTLRELLTIIKDTHINGSCLVISRKGLTANELDKTLEELGIHDNTTLHLIAEWPLEKGS